MDVKLHFNLEVTYWTLLNQWMTAILTKMVPLIGHIFTIEA